MTTSSLSSATIDSATYTSFLMGLSVARGPRCSALLPWSRSPAARPHNDPGWAQRRAGPVAMTERASVSVQPRWLTPAADSSRAY
jgi:hypothetical protein